MQIQTFAGIRCCQLQPPARPREQWWPVGRKAVAINLVVEDDVRQLRHVQQYWACQIEPLPNNFSSPDVDRWKTLNAARQCYSRGEVTGTRLVQGGCYTA